MATTNGSIVVPPILGTTQREYLGSSIAINFNNNRVATGHVGYNNYQGKVTINDYIESSNTWFISTTIIEPSTSSGSYFGHDISMNWSGTRIAIGAYGENNVYVYDATSTSSNP